LDNKWQKNKDVSLTCIFPQFNSLHIKRLRPVTVWLVLLLILLACGGEDDSGSNGATEQPSDTPNAPFVRVTADSAPVFAEPVTSSEVIITLFEGDLRRILNQSPPDVVGLRYYQLDLGNRTGWIAETQVELLGDMSLVVVLNPTPIAPTQMATPAIEATIETPTTTPAPTQTPTIPVARVNVSRAIVFTLPSRSSETLVTLFEGEQFVASSVTEPNNLGDVFYEIELGTQRGWVLNSQIEILGDPTLLTVVDPNDVQVLDEPTPEPTTIAQATPEATPTSVLTNPDDSTLEPTATPVATSSSPLDIQVFEPPPLSIDIPAEWDAIHVLVPVANGIAAGNVAMSVYEGSLGNGLTGTIWIIWGFPNVLNPRGEADLWSDGLQLLRGLLFDGCNIGIDAKRDYVVGSLPAVGTIFSAVDCPEGDDIAGWFAALRVSGGNYAFFMGVQPVDRVGEGIAQLQPVIDSVVFEDLDS
jgi:hypothetical protein